MMLRVLLVDDHETVREGIKLLINTQDDMKVIGEAENGQMAVKKTVELNPDVVVMDVSMPELNGMKATKLIKTTNPKMKVLILTRHTDDGYLQQLIQAGANGYVLKQSPPNQLINALRVVGEDKSFLDPTLTEKVMGGYIRQSTALEGASKVQLTDRESEVIRLIAWGYSNKEIADRLQVSIKTVEAHKANSMKKLGINSRTDIIRYAILQGWLDDDD
jgi:DNA-binding NarL/FixJ family response regulator